MATYSGQMSGSADFVLQLIVTETATNIEANTSTVTWSLRAVDADSINATFGNYSTSWSINVGSASSGSKASFDFRDGDTEVIASGTKTVTHNADGTKTLSVSGTWDSEHSSIGHATVSGSITLTAIPRGPQIKHTDGTYHHTILYVKHTDNTWHVAIPYTKHTDNTWHVGAG